MGIADAVASGLWYLAVSHVSDLNEFAKIEFLVEWLDQTNIEVVTCCEAWQRIELCNPDPFENQLPQARMLIDKDENGKPDGFTGCCEWDTTSLTPVDSTRCIKVYGDAEFYCYGPEVGASSFSIWLKSLSGDNCMIRLIIVKYGFDWDILEEIWITLRLTTAWARYDSSYKQDFIINVEDEVDRIRFIIRPVDSAVVQVCYPQLIWIPVGSVTQQVARHIHVLITPNPVRCGTPITVRAHCQVELLNVLGRRMLVSETSQNGWQMIPTDGLAPGVYFVSHPKGCFRAAKVIVLK